MDASWRKRAHDVIAQLCFDSWRQANTLRNGRLRKRHVQYRVPAQAANLIDCLGDNDEERAKSILCRPESFSD